MYFIQKLYNRIRNRYPKLYRFRQTTICSIYIKLPQRIVASIFLPSISFVNKSIYNSRDEISDIEDNITHLIILAKVALEKGDRERAEAILHMGIKICEENNLFFGIPYMYDILATIALADGDVEKAENLLVNVIENMIQNGLTEDNHHIIDFKLRLSRIYSTYRDIDLAEIGFKSCLEAQKSKILDGDVSTKTSMLYVNILFWYGIHKIRNSNYEGAKTLLDTAYEYSNRIKGLSPYQEMVILYTLADLNLELEQFDVALINMQNAVMLGKGIGSTDLPRCYVKLAKIYLKLEAFDQAKKTAEEAIKLAVIFNITDVVEDSKEILNSIQVHNQT